MTSKMEADSVRNIHQSIRRASTLGLVVVALFNSIFNLFLVVFLGHHTKFDFGNLHEFPVRAHSFSL